MGSKPPVDDLRNVLTSELATLKATGHTAVSIDQLVAYLGTLPAPDDRERHFEWTKHTTSLQHASWVEMFKSTIEAGGTTLKILITINGGAAAALLAFLSNLIGKQLGTPLQGRISQAMAVYVGGVALAGATSACRYLTQLMGARAVVARAAQDENGAKKLVKVGNVITGIAILLGLGSLGAFCLGGWWSYLALRG